jgi:transcriptional regulator with XRE-family HTH domain
MDIKDIIRNRRLELGLTYEELGKMVGVGKSTVRKWETGMIENMKRDNIIALAKALNVSPAIIMGWKDAYNNIPEDYLDKYKVTKRDINQYQDIIKHAQTFMMDDKVDPNDKQKLFEIVNKLYWESKAINKEKYSKSKNNK